MKIDESMKLDSQLCFPLYAASRKVVSLYTPYLKPLGITYTQYIMFLVLWEQDCQPVNDIAHRLMLETNTVTPLLQRMEKAELVKRAKGKEDNRQRIVSLTKKGIEMREQAKHIPDCLSNEIIQITDEEEEFVRMIPTLDKLIKGLKKQQTNQ